MNARWTLALFVLCLLGNALCAAKPGVVAAGPGVVVIENRSLRLEIGRTPAPYIQRLVHKASGTAVVADPKDKSLFAILLDNPGGGTETVESGRARQSAATVARTEAGSRLRLTYSQFGGPDLSVEVVADAPENDRLVRWTIRVANGSGRRIAGVRFPTLVAVPQIGSHDDDVLVLPALPGVLIENPAKAWSPSRSATLRFPGDMSAQFVAYQDRVAGVYLAGMDAQSLPMSLTVARRADGFLLSHQFTPLASDGKDFQSPYPVALAVTQGAWYDTADLYKQWAVRQPWCARTLAQRDDIPAWWKAAPAVHVLEVRTYDAQRTCSGSYYPKLLDHLRAFRKAIEGPVVPMLAGWENHRRWTAGDYFPVFDEANARHVIGRLRDDGFRPFFFLSGLYHTFENEGRDASRIPAAEQYRAHFVVDEKTKRPQVWSLDESSPGGSWRRHSYQFCVGDRFTRDFFCGVIDRAGALGVDVLQMDQTVQGAGAACFSAEHGHAPGVGLYQTRDFYKLLERMRAHGKARSPDFVLFHEEPHEQLIPYLDGFHVREYYEKRWYRGQPGSVGIPLFSYLYHEYAMGYGGDSAGLSRNKSPWLVRCHAMNLVAGRTPGAAVWGQQPSALEAHADQLAMLRTHSRLLATRARDFLILGKMLHPYELDVPQLPYTLHADGAKHDFTRPAVLTSSWQSPDGRVGHLFVNVSDARQRLTVPLDTRNAPALARCRVEIFRSTAGPGFTPLWSDVALPRPLATELAPLEAVFVEIRAGR